MAEAYIGEIRLVGFNFAPPGWHLCDGATLSISEFTELYAIVGTTFGGDGVNTFALPDLRGRVPIHQGTGTGLSTYTIGAQGGLNTVTLTTAQMASHTHLLGCQTGTGNAESPATNFFATAPSNVFSSTGNQELMGSQVSSIGGSQPHDNMQPYSVVNYLIALFGVYPAQG